MKIREQLQHPPDRLFRSSNILILGKPKSGKTRLASTVGRLSFDEPCPLLALDQDNGSSAHKYVNPAMIPENFADYRTVLDGVTRALMKGSEPPYQMNLFGREWQFSGLIIDTINRMQDIVRRGIKGGYISEKRLRIQDYGALLDDVLGTILALKEISETKPFHLVVTAQIAPDKVTIQDAKDEDPGSYYWLPSLAGSIAPKLPEHFDMVLTTYFDPKTQRYTVFSRDTITPMGTFMGGMRFGHYCNPQNPPTAPSTWWDILKLHQIDIDNTQSIGQLDVPEQVHLHWSEIEKNREKLAGILAKKGIPIELLFKACEVKDWEQMKRYEGSGQDAVLLAEEMNGSK